MPFVGVAQLSYQLTTVNHVYNDHNPQVDHSKSRQTPTIVSNDRNLQVALKDLEGGITDLQRAAQLLPDDKGIAGVWGAFLPVRD
jgi:hypothetical protein